MENSKEFDNLLACVESRRKVLIEKNKATKMKQQEVMQLWDKSVIEWDKLIIQAAQLLVSATQSEKK